MTRTETNIAGDFTHWDTERREELKKGMISTSVGQELVYEDDRHRLWQIMLKPGERIPFHRHQEDYSWTSLTAGKARSHYATGRIVDLEYVKGDLSFYDHARKDDFVHDLENVGETTLQFVTIEYLKTH